jgi:glycine reductase
LSSCKNLEVQINGLPYSLDLHTIHIEELELGQATALQGRRLVVGEDQVRQLILEDERIAEADLQIAHPGHSTRIVHCLDAVEPRRKLSGPGTAFPGFLGGPETVGRGSSLRLAGISVLTSSRYPQPFEGLLAAREAIVDMAGPTSAYSPMSRVTNLVLVLEPAPGLDNEDYDDAVRRASLKVANHLALAAEPNAADEVVTFDFSQVDPNLPRIGYFYQMQGQGSMADTYLYGRTIENLVPTVMHPNEFLDGAVVSGVYVYACFKNPTYWHQNNPVIFELQRRHGRDLNFMGVIANRGHNYTQREKERSSYWASKLAEFLHLDGVILSAEGGGNSAIDMMLAVQYMEQAGIDTTAMAYESPGADGRDFPLFFSVPQAEALVSVGSDEEMVHMPRVDRVIGDDLLLDNETEAIGPFDIRMYYLYNALNQLGANVLTGRAF